MKIVTLFGSPRKKGNTATVLTWVEDELKGMGHKVERVIMTKYDVKGCISCYACHKSLDKPGCAQKDDAGQIFDKMMEADGIIYASPLYCWSWAAQIKPLIDRHFCLVKGYGTENWKSMVEGKRTGLVMTAGGDVANNAELGVKQFENLATYGKTNMKGSLIITLCSTPDQLGEKAQEMAKRFTAEFVS